jgi:hypothetical protein
MGQLDLYAALWKGKVIVLVTGESHRDLMNALTKKIEALKGTESFFDDEKYFLGMEASFKSRADPSQGGGAAGVHRRPLTGSAALGQGRKESER